MRLGDQAEQRAVAVEAPGPALLDDLEPRLVVAVEQLVGHLAGRRLVGQLERLRAEPLDADDGDQARRQDAAYRGIGFKVFETAHVLLSRKIAAPARMLVAEATSHILPLSHVPISAE